MLGPAVSSPAEVALLSGSGRRRRGLTHLGRLFPSGSDSLVGRTGNHIRRQKHSVKQWSRSFTNPAVAVLYVTHYVMIGFHLLVHFNVSSPNVHAANSNGNKFHIWKKNRRPVRSDNNNLIF